MALERTLTIIKPDAVSAGNSGHIIAHLEREGFKIVAMKKITLTRAQAQAFYAVHSQRPFFDSLVDFMTSGPIIPMVLERDNAIVGLREVMGATNPEHAEEGTVRKLYATNIERNAIHGSDAPETAAVERAFFFSGLEQG